MNVRYSLGDYTLKVLGCDKSLMFWISITETATILIYMKVISQKLSIQKNSSRICSMLRTKLLCLYIL